MLSQPAYPASSTSATRSSTSAWMLPVFAMLMLQVVLYVWMAFRGFDFTDESYYFANYLHWREFTGTVTFFGAYFEWPFRLMNESIAGIRIFSLCLVLIGSAALMRQIQLFLPQETLAGGTALIQYGLLAPMASGMLYFSYLATLRAPSYNLLTLFAMSMATVFLLRAMRQLDNGRPWIFSTILYGAAVGACFFSKATTSLLMVAVHCVFFFAVSRAWKWTTILGILAWASLGFLINPTLLTLAYPHWLASMQEGIQVIQMRGDYGTLAMIRDLSWELQRVLFVTGPWMVLAAFVVFFSRRKLAAASSVQLSILTVLLLAANGVGIIFGSKEKTWLFLTLATALLLWMLEVLKRPRGGFARSDWKELCLMGLLFSLPLAFSFGTNMPVFAHSIIASIFPYCALYQRLYKLSSLGLISNAAMALGACFLCLPALFYQLAPLVDVNYTYRQRTSLLEQETPVVIGRAGSQLRVDAVTDASLRAISSAARQAGFTQGQSMLDFSGDGPGIIFALGAKPLGTPWMIGGYPESAKSAERVVSKIAPAMLEQSWLLTSPNNARKIDGWEAMLARRIGTGSHQLAASVEIASPYSWDPKAPKSIVLQLWKPAARPGNQAGR